MRVLITGGTGYIGTELCHRLMQRNDITELVVYDNLSRKNFNFFLGPKKLAPHVRFVDADILDTYTLRKEVSRADVVVHLAAKVSTPFSDENPHLFDQVNNWGTAELSYAIEASPCQRVIYASSASVYGVDNEHGHIDTTPNPKTFYGISKLKGERHVARLANKMPVHIVRIANVYGYSRCMRFDAVINRFVFHARHHKRISINGNGEQRRSFVHIDTVTEFFEALIAGKGRITYYNLVDHNITINDVAYTLKEIHPDLEMLYVDQQLSLRQMQLAPDPGARVIVPVRSASLLDDLREFTGALA
jgi:UDP-glucose 4-epimerase